VREGVKGRGDRGYGLSGVGVCGCYMQSLYIPYSPYSPLSPYIPLLFPHSLLTLEDLPDLEEAVGRDHVQEVREVYLSVCGVWGVMCGVWGVMCGV